MSGRGQLFIGRLPLDTRERDVEQVFERYGRLLRCDVKYEEVLSAALPAPEQSFRSQDGCPSNAWSCFDLADVRFVFFCLLCPHGASLGLGVLVRLRRT
ncbi:hypothetical protein HPB50_007477 [Hyalomma asiaticum]|uniref:Uncharacterized protein n=1 Tax=Hyalomma asiaticum TaxID=266040 RepID=A0ACB7SPF8_HYAAI|nr:hypothetical protein HPB50_007477 [Hyalomma asiaticum]